MELDGQRWIQEPMGAGMQRLWRVDEVRWEGDTEYQHVLIGQTEQGVSLFCDDDRQSTEFSQLVYHEAMMVPGFLLAGIGMGLLFAPASTAVLQNMLPRDHAVASGANSTLREIGVALGVAVLTAVFTGAGGRLTPTGYVDAARPAVFVGAAVVGLAAVAALFLPGRRSAVATPSTEPELVAA